MINLLPFTSEHCDVMPFELCTALWRFDQEIHGLKQCVYGCNQEIWRFILPYSLRLTIHMSINLCLCKSQHNTSRTPGTWRMGSTNTQALGENMVLQPLTTGALKTEISIDFHTFPPGRDHSWGCKPKRYRLTSDHRWQHRCARCHADTGDVSKCRCTGQVSKNGDVWED